MECNYIQDDGDNWNNSREEKTVTRTHVSTSIMGRAFKALREDLAQPKRLTVRPGKKSENFHLKSTPDSGLAR